MHARRFWFAAGMLIAANVLPVGASAPAWGARLSHAYPSVRKVPPPPAVVAWLLGDPRRSGSAAYGGSIGR